MFVYRNATPIISNCYRTISIYTNINMIGKTGNCLIHGIIQNFRHQVMHCLNIRAADVHSRAMTYRLKTFFKGIYAEFYHNGIRGDDLLDRLVSEIVGMIPKPATHPAAYAIIVHLFEFCDLFEKPRQ